MVNAIRLMWKIVATVPIQRLGKPAKSSIIAGLASEGGTHATGTRLLGERWSAHGVLRANGATSRQRGNASR
jgi:hypothetical protein